MSYFYKLLPLISLCLALSLGFYSHASDFDHRSTNEFSPSDYLFGSFGELEDLAFDQYQTIDLSVDLGVGSDCGRIDIKNTLKAAFQNVIDEKYLEGMGRNIIAASPMLLISYFSPTWASVIKHSRLRANFLAQLRLNQCRAINKFVDNRVSDYYEERSKCIQNSIQQHDGNFERAMENCKNYKDYELSSWSGDGKSIENRLIESTAKWAGFEGDDADRVVALTKSFIGESILKEGNLSVDFGPRRVQLTPRTYLMEKKTKVFSKLCKDLLKRIIKVGGYKSNIYRHVSDSDLMKLSDSGKKLIDRQTILSLAYLPYKKRQAACRKLSDAIAMSIYSEDMGKTLDFISSKMMTNPHYPTKRKYEVDQKRRTFKDQVELTLAFEEQNSEPLNQVLYQINLEGKGYMNRATQRELNSEVESYHDKRMESIFFDCGDNIGCL